MSGSQQHCRMLTQNAMGCCHCGVHRCLNQHLQAAWPVTTLTFRSAPAIGKVIDALIVVNGNVQFTVMEKIVCRTIFELLCMELTGTISCRLLWLCSHTRFFHVMNTSNSLFVLYVSLYHVWSFGSNITTTFILIIYIKFFFISSFVHFFITGLVAGWP